MSYLTMSGGIPNFTKAVISLWFRIPKVSIDAAAAAFEAAWNTGDASSPYQYGTGWVAGGQLGFSAYDAKSPQMAGIIPLLTFGETGSSANFAYKTISSSHLVTHYFWHPLPPYEANHGEWLIQNEMTEQIEDQVLGSPTATWATEPSYIGVWCTANPPRALLAVNLELGTRATITGALPDLIGHTVTDRQFYTGGPTEMIPLHSWAQVFTYGDANPNPALPQTECFRTHPLISDVGQYDGTTDESPPFGIEIIPDHWHHLLLSFDLTAPCKTHGVTVTTTEELTNLNNAPNPSPFVDNAPKLWIAFDDANKKGREVSYYWRGKGATGSPYDPPRPDQPDAENADPNEVLSPQGWRVAATQSKANYTTTTFSSSSSAFVSIDGILLLGTNETYTETVTGLSPPQYNSGAGTIQAQSKPMGLPASAEWVDDIYRVEMAEFQMFTGLMLDTNVRTNRRAFVDSDGKPVPATQQQSTDDGGNIVKDSGSIERLGKRPELLLHGSNNWIAGYNTGSTGVKIETISGEEVATKLPSGQFTPVAGIEAWKPDPSLEETTS